LGGESSTFVDTKERLSRWVGVPILDAFLVSSKISHNVTSTVSYHHTQVIEATTMVQLANVDQEKVVNLARRYTNDAENDLLRKLITENRS
jgi:hypothetical protein